MGEIITGSLGKLRVGDGEPVRVVGVINLSPESFYCGSVVRGAGDALKAADRMIGEGADALDVGAMSTAPYLKTAISEGAEKERLVPVLKELCRAFDVPICADTQRAAVAEEALACGASAVNDVSGEVNPGVYKVAARYGASLIVMAGGRGPVQDPVAATVESLGGKIDAAASEGVGPERLLVDPGIGFIRDTGIPWYERDVMVIANLESLRALRRPVYIGVSRKSFIGRLTGVEEPSGRLAGSLAMATLSIFNGAHVVRTHDPLETSQAAKLAEYAKRYRHRQSGY